MYRWRWRRWSVTVSMQVIQPICDQNRENQCTTVHFQYRCMVDFWNANCLHGEAQIQWLSNFVSMNGHVPSTTLCGEQDVIRFCRVFLIECLCAFSMEIIDFGALARHALFAFLCTRFRPLASSLFSASTRGMSLPSTSPSTDLYLCTCVGMRTYCPVLKLNL